MLEFQKFDYNVSLDRQQKLFAECFPEVFDDAHTSISYSTDKYKWLFQSYPAATKSYEYAAMIKDDLVGYYAALPFVYKIGNRTYSSGMVCGVMTSPKQRKAGIFTKLGNFAAEEQTKAGVDFNLTFPIRKAVMPGFMRMGWEVGFEMPLYIKFLKLNSLLQRKKLGVLAPVFNIGAALYSTAFRKKNNADIKIVTFKKFEEISGYGEFVKAYEQATPNTLKKDAAFSKWRYGAPGAEYLFLCAYRADRLIGFVSLRAMVREGVPSYGIVDFMYTEGVCLNSLYNAMEERARANGIEAIMTMMSKFSAGKYRILSHGFLKSPFKFHFIFKNLSGKIEQQEMFSEKDWHLMFVDTDDL